MGNKSSLMLQDEEIKQISEETGFSPAQIEKLYTRFANLDRGNCGYLTKNDLMSIPELAINPLCDRLLQIFFLDSDGEEERINFRQFMKVLATFVPTNHLKTTSIGDKSRTRTKSAAKISPVNHQLQTSRQNETGIDNTMEINDGLRNKLHFVFRVYDADNDGKISFNDLKYILKMMVGNYIDDVQLDKITRRAFDEVDEDRDGYIEFSEFCRVLRRKDLDDKLRVKFFN